MWKKLSGIRVSTVENLVYFSGKTVEPIYETISDWKQFGKVNYYYY